MDNARFDDTAKEQVRDRMPIANLVERYVKLKPAGRNLKGLCPFHKEKTPSFIVTPDRGTFHCFGCNKSGDIFTFLQEMERIEFKEALRMLAEETGVKLATGFQHAEETPTGFPSKAEMLAIHDRAMKFYYHRIKGAQHAIDYFKSRGLKPETIREFGLGYAPEGWSNLIDHMAANGVTGESLVACGLALRKEGGTQPYDRFRGRIIFTLFDISGRAIGFAARAMEKETQPKYLNSPETPIYHKSRTLYGLHKSRAAIKDEGSVIVVEGYMDFLALYQEGIRNAVATSGTAMTADHCHILRRFASRINLVFDGDSAGITAAERGSVILAPFGLDVRVLILPGDEDPDSFIKKYGADEFKKLLAGSVDALSFLIARALKAHDITTPLGKSAALEFLVPYLQALTDQVVRMESIRIAAQRLGIDERLIMTRTKPDRAAAPFDPGTAARTGEYTGQIEGNFLRILLAHPEHVPQARTYISPETFTDAIASELYSVILTTYEQDAGLSPLLGNITNPEVKALAAALLAKQGPEEHLSEDLMYLMECLQVKFLKGKEKEITLMLKSDPANRRLLQVQMEIKKQIADLDRKEW